MNLLYKEKNTLKLVNFVQIFSPLKFSMGYALIYGSEVPLSMVIALFSISWRGCRVG